ncbi:MAG: hypothetical protein JST58_08360 [Bacteroidetes bacterium]|nr:hypothetical protein [Bacteroidota bacterium]
MISGKFDLDYYGISYMDPNGKIVYFATALEKGPGEAKNTIANDSSSKKGLIFQ